MREEFKKYLETIRMTDVLSARIQSIYRFYEAVCPEEIGAIFVTDIVNDEGVRQYENLWFFSKTFAMESKVFISQDDFDMMPIKNKVIYWSIRKQNYDFEKAEDGSRLRVFYRSDNDVTGELRASRENCDFLRDIFLQRILPSTATS